LLVIFSYLRSKKKERKESIMKLEFFFNICDLLIQEFLKILLRIYNKVN